MKSHFQFTKGQRNGILFLAVLIIILQCLYYFVDFNSPQVNLDSPEITRFNKEVDSLRLVSLQNNQPKIYPFNPNYISDFRGYTLGMTNEEIDRLIEFRKSGKWINSVKQFQLVTQVSDSLLTEIAPYFKFPDWVSKTPQSSFTNRGINTPRTFDQKYDLNTATAIQLQGVNGIGKVLSERIIRFRNSFDGGFISDVQLGDVYGLSSEVIERLINQFTVKTPRQVQKIALNEIISA